MDFILKFLAGLFDRFKAKSPVLAAVLLLILGALVYTADKGTLLGLFTLPEWAAQGVQWISTFLGFLTGSQTWQYLQKK